MLLLAWLEVASILIATLLAASAVAPWLATVFRIDSADGVPGRCDSWLERLERPVLRLAGVWPVCEMTAGAYAAAIFVFHAAGIFLLVAIQRLQPLLHMHRVHGCRRLECPCQASQPRQWRE